MHLLCIKQGPLVIVVARHPTRGGCILEAMNQKLIFGTGRAGYWLRPGVEIIKEP